MRYLLLILSIAIPGCSDIKDDVWPRERYRLQSGEIVECRWATEYQCGVYLTECTNSREYQCQTGVEVL